MRLVLALSSAFVCVATGVARCQDTAVVSTAGDSLRKGRIERLQDRTRSIARRSVVGARQTERLVFGADSAVALWSQHDDPLSRTLRGLAPVAFWVPVATVAAVPLVWADEAEDGHHLNAEYARNTAAALAVGFIVSRTTKHFIHRARPCTGSEPDQITARPLPDTLPQCPAGTHVSSYSSFFSEHTMALFTVASATTFQAQRRRAPNAATVAAVGFGGAAVFSVARIYQRHHWLTDVLAGAAVGTASGFLAAQLVPAARRR